MNNAVYGKTMENMRKRVKIRVVKNNQGFIKYTSRAIFVNWEVFETNLSAIHEKKISLTLNPYMQDLQYQKQVNGKCMIFTIVLGLENLIPDYFLLTQIVYVTKFMEKTA